MYRASALISAVFAVVTVSLWAWFNQPVAEPPWPKQIQGFSFSPLRADDDAVAKEYPSEEEIAADLEQLAGKTHAVRTYTVEGTLAAVPRLAAEQHINVAVGAWIDNRRELNEQELARLIPLVNGSRNVVRVMVGNEVVLRGDIPLAELTDYLDRVRAAVWKPVSTAEPWHVWIKHPELAAHVDYLAVHMLPYWEGIDVDVAVDYVMERLDELRRTFPAKPIVIAEVGWPSAGRTRQAAVASRANEALFLRRFLQRAEEQKLVYYLMEAFDQPWKSQTEGAVGAYWGVYDVQRAPKFPFDQAVVRIPHWQVLAGLSVIIALILLAFLFLDSRALRKSGRSFLAVVAYAAATLAVWVIYDYSQLYLSVYSVTVGVLLVMGMVGVITVLLAEAHEWAEAHWVTGRRRLHLPRPFADDETPPFVSIHVPAYNEPPAMLIETLEALARLDYPHYEVVVIDNNTKDPEVWQPVAAHCAKLGPRFRFFHEDPLAGYKAGALNFALAHTDSRAEIIAVIDSDYIVTPRWLRDLTPAFREDTIAIVQAPQDYRDAGESLFKAMCHVEYRGFFYLGMITRNERNAIIQHGTMTLMRRMVLEEVGGWSEWCITEDAELGLRIFERGYEASYIPLSYGKGVMPDTYSDYKKQRLRWAYGAIQILREHWRPLLSHSASKLSLGQRYHFLAGWLPWLADGVNLLFNFAALAWTLAILLSPRVEVPLMIFSAMPLALFAFKVVKLFHLYATRVGARPGQTVAAAVAGLGLMHTIGVAVITGLFTRGLPFFRTPKRARSHALLRAFFDAREEALFMAALLFAAWAIAHTQNSDTPDVLVWIVMLVVQAIPYAASVVVSVISGVRYIPASLLGSPAGMDERAEARLPFRSPERHSH